MLPTYFNVIYIWQQSIAWTHRLISCSCNITIADHGRSGLKSCKSEKSSKIVIILIFRCRFNKPQIVINAVLTSKSVAQAENVVEELHLCTAVCVQVLSHSGVSSSWVVVRAKQQQTSYKVNTRAYCCCCWCYCCWWMFSAFFVCWLFYLRAL